ncbi:hypothetical protein GV829_07585 [Sphingomonas lacunae]|uniref:Uncharacterized protein n=1 Tax=Sphingomonas lacunae TaxID=2698828 RepID=A0A6M4AX37_9SPHN|nr:hypothetical protein GV829_07585 [Sphingomonas lacunae]
MLSLSLGACRDNAERAQLAVQDDGLTSNDPAVRGAIEDQIMVDPALAGRSNAAAATVGAQPVTGGVPAARAGGSPQDAVNDVRTQVGTLLSTPAPGRWEDTCDTNCSRAAARPATLGGLAREQAGNGCAADIRYGAEWANRMPATFPVYPRANLVEAAGVANGTCNVRVVNFRTRVPMQAVLDYYYTRATRDGYSAEHLLRGSEHYLGGTKGDFAYVIMLRNEAGGIVDVDIVASGGN